MDFPGNKNIGKIEKRREPRANNIFVDYSLKESSQKISTFAKNISSCGICILLLENVETDSTLFLTIHLPDEPEPVHVKGKIVWSKPSPFLFAEGKCHFEAGIDYIEINTSDQARIMQNVIRSCGIPLKA